MCHRLCTSLHWLVLVTTLPTIARILAVLAQNIVTMSLTVVLAVLVVTVAVPSTLAAVAVLPGAEAPAAPTV